MREDREEPDKGSKGEFDKEPGREETRASMAGFLIRKEWVRWTGIQKHKYKRRKTK